jgi:hypothetical protein
VITDVGSKYFLSDAIIPAKSNLRFFTSSIDANFLLSSGSLFFYSSFTFLAKDGYTNARTL